MNNNEIKQEPCLDEEKNMHSSGGETTASPAKEEKTDSSAAGEKTRLLPTGTISKAVFAGRFLK